MESISTVQTVENKIGSNRSASREAKEKDLMKLNFLETVRGEERTRPKYKQ
jgi:hypothetical protein